MRIDPRRGSRANRALTLSLLGAVGLVILLPLPALGERVGPAIYVEYPAPRATDRIVSIVLGGVRYVSTNDLARIFGATKYWRSEVQKLTLRIEEHTIRFTVGAPLVLVDEAGKNLVEPSRLVQGVVYVPESIVHKLLEWGIVTEATWDEASRTIRFRSAVHTVRQAQLFPRGRVTEISATLLRGLPPRILYATPSEIRILFEGGTLDTARVFAGGVVRDGSIREVPGGVELFLRLNEGARGYAVSVGAGRLKVSVTDDKDLSEAGLFTPLEPISIGGTDRIVRTIVIDPGHGGTDLGAALPGGIAEKDAALDMARALRDAIVQRLGARVVLTRESDDDVPAIRRAEVANELRADLFVSIHLDAEGTIQGGGFRILTLSPITGIADGQGDASPEEIDGVPFRFWSRAQASVVGTSMALAQSIADSLRRGFPQTPVRVGTGRMRILEPVECPAIFLESAPASRSGPEAMSRGYTIYDYTRIVAEAIERFVKAARG